MTVRTFSGGTGLRLRRSQRGSGRTEPFRRLSGASSPSRGRYTALVTRLVGLGRVVYDRGYYSFQLLQAVFHLQRNASARFRDFILDGRTDETVTVTASAEELAGRPTGRDFG